MTDTINDNDASFARPRDIPDAHGQAAILLVESLIHALVERSIISGEDAISLVTTACDVESELATDENGVPDATDKALMLLSTIRQSLSVDLV